MQFWVFVSVCFIFFLAYFVTDSGKGNKVKLLSFIFFILLMEFLVLDTGERDILQLGKTMIFLFFTLTLGFSFIGSLPFKGFGGKKNVRGKKDFRGNWDFFFFSVFSLAFFALYEALVLSVHDLLLRELLNSWLFLVGSTSILPLILVFLLRRLYVIDAGILVSIFIAFVLAVLKHM